MAGYWPSSLFDLSDLSYGIQSTEKMIFVLFRALKTGSQLYAKVTTRFGFFVF